MRYARSSLSFSKAIPKKRASQREKNQKKMKSRLFRELGQRLLGLVYPRKCVLCDMRIAPFEACVCTECALELAHYSELHSHARERLLGSPLVKSLSSPFAYQHTHGVHRLIVALKYEGIREVAGFIVRSAIYGGVLQPHPQDIDLIVPVPITQERLQQRGFNQAALLAQHLSAYYHAPLEEHLVIHHPGSISQTKLSREERQKNARHAFGLTPESARRERVTGKRILLVDDVLTTGATLLAVCDLLESCGVQEVHIFVAAVAVRH